MVTTSSEYMAAIRALGRTDRITGSLTLVDSTEIKLSDANVEDGSVSVSWECVSGEEIEFGSTTMAQLDMAIRSDLSRYVFYGAKILLNYGVMLADGSWFDVPLGAFTVAEAERKSTLVELTAYDNLLAMDEDYGGKVLYGTPFEILTAICEECGLILATTEEELLSMPNGDQMIQVDETSGCSTYRDCAKVVTQMIGGFVVADRRGAIAVKRYGKEAAATIPRRNRFSTTMADYICSYMGLRVVSSSGEYRAYDANQEEGLELTIQDAPAWDYGMEETLQARVDTLLGEVIQLIYTPGNLTMAGDPALECGDLVELEMEDGSTVATMITSLDWKYHGRMTIKSAGVNPYLKSQVTRKTVVLRELQSQTTENKLIFYSFTNQAEVKATDDTPVEISQVTVVTTKSTSAMFIAQLPIEVTCEDTVEKTVVDSEKTVSVTDSAGASATITDANGNPLTLKVIQTDTDTVVTPGYVDIQIEYYLLGTLVDYQLIQRCHAGSHILGLFYAFDSLDGNANYQWQVKIRVVGGSGTVTVPKRAFRATITGQGLAGTAAWDGTLNFDEAVEAIPVSLSMALSVTGEVTTEIQIPAPADFVQTVAAISLRSRLTLGALSERVSTTEIRQKKTIDPGNAEWQFNDRYAAIENGGIMARVRWQYESAEQTIDQGRMTAVKAVTNDLVSVEEVTVSG